MTSQDTLSITLPAHLQHTLDRIVARNRAQFGHDAFRMEGDGDGGDAGAGDAGGDAAGSGDAAGADKAGAGDADKGVKDKGGAGEKVEDLPDWAQRIIEDTRAEAATNRVSKTAAEQKQADMLDVIAKGLGLKGEDKVDPAKLQEQLATTQQQARTAAVELAVFRSASKHQGDPDALLDSRGFLAKLADLDPSDGKFQDKVAAAIKDAVDANPKLKTTQAAGSSSADHGAGGPGEGKARTPKSLADSVSGHYGT